MRVNIEPDLLRWARERADMDIESLIGRFPKYAEWETGDLCPTLKQLEKLAKAVHTPLGYFFLSTPPNEPFPIPDFRTMEGTSIKRPSLNLRDTVYLCQQRQDWYHEYLQFEGETRLPFVGSASLTDSIDSSAAGIRDTLDFDMAERRTIPTWTAALRRFVEIADAVGVLVMVSGIVGSNTQRKLDPKEFRGFALADDFAPLIFVNGMDTKAAQMFTLAHELAHIWLGQSALSDSRPDYRPTHEVETWCNGVAAELLAPLAVVREEYHMGEDLSKAVARLARHFKVSTLVILRRIYDVGGLSMDQFRSAYSAEVDRLTTLSVARGGTFYPTLKARVGRRFGHALVTSTLGGRTSFSESFRLLGVRKMATFREAAATLGVAI